MNPVNKILNKKEKNNKKFKLLERLELYPIEDDTNKL